MRFGKFLPAALAAAAALLVLAGATATAAGTSPSLSSPSKINAYLRSIGVNPATMVWQHGKRNYAGSRCPGKRWTCTRSTRVIQVASDNGQNQVNCSGTSTVTPTESCVVVQVGPGANVAQCIEHSTDDAAVQDCNITQTGTTNSAVINQIVSSNGLSAQTATQTAEVSQTASGGDNQLVLHQHANQNERGSASTQTAVQTAFPVNQTTTGSGSNSAQVHQKQKQTETGPASSQMQNATGGPDCNNSGFEPTTPNECVYVTQTTDSGTNTSGLDQALDELETTNGSATQVQGSLTGGLDASADQTAGPTGTSLEKVVQRKQHQERSAGGPQTQHDPMYGGGLSQFGGTGDQQSVKQSATESASGGSPLSQTTDIVGTGHTPGSCAVGQTARQNAASSSVNESQGDCTTPLLVETNCTSSTFPSEVGPPLTFGNCEVTNPPPPCIDCILLLDAGPNTTFFNSTPTNGALLDPLDLSDQT